MGLMWMIMGLLAGASILAYYFLLKRFQFDPFTWVGLITGEFLILFGIAWSVSSVAEGVPQSGSMGAIMFIGLGLITLVIAHLLWSVNTTVRSEDGLIESTYTTR